MIRWKEGELFHTLLFVGLHVQHILYAHTTEENYTVKLNNTYNQEANERTISNLPQIRLWS